MNNQNLKYKNRGLLLKLICTCEEPSRVQLSQMTGLTKMTVTNIIADDKLYQNSSGFVGELGHISIDYQGEPCSCGRRGCLECYISKPVMLEKLRKATGWELTFREFFQKADDFRIDSILTEMVYKLSYALVNQVNMLNPRAIFIGQEGAFLPDRYIDLLRNEVNQKKFSPDYLQIRVEKSPFGFYAPLYGSACIVLDYLFQSGKLKKEEWIC